MGQDTRERVYVKNSTGGELIDHHQEWKQKEQTDEKQSASKESGAFASESESLSKPLPRGSRVKEAIQGAKQ
jgi:hypothetical protein